MRDESLWKRIDKTETCWLWTGAHSKTGYGFVSSWVNGESTCKPVHRYVYELLVGPIPSGLELDHLCRVRNCVNPEHLEPVTHSENMRRSPINRGAHQLKKTHCPQGHPYDEVNTYAYKGHRYCRACTKRRLEIKNHYR